MVLHAKNLSKTYKGPHSVKVLSNINLEVKKNETLAIMGKSGEGKTTLLHILGTLETFCEGTLEVCGHKIPSNETSLIRNAHVGFIFQAYHLLEDYSALENVLLPAKIGRKPLDISRGKELLELVGLLDRADFLAKSLSGGEKQRVAIARALCNNPDLILADEPSGNLDQATGKMISDLLIRTAKNLGKTLIVVTHDKDLAAACDRTLTLKNGELCTS